MATPVRISAPVDLTGWPLELYVYYLTHILQWNLQVLAAAAAAAAASSSGANRRIFLLCGRHRPASPSIRMATFARVSLRCQWSPVTVREVHCMRLQASVLFARSPLPSRIQHWHPLRNEMSYETYDTRTQSFSVSARSCSGDGPGCIGSTELLHVHVSVISFFFQANLERHVKAPALIFSLIIKRFGAGDDGQEYELFFPRRVLSVARLAKNNKSLSATKRHSVVAGIPVRSKPGHVPSSAHFVLYLFWPLLVFDRPLPAAATRRSAGNSGGLTVR